MYVSFVVMLLGSIGSQSIQHERESLTWIDWHVFAAPARIVFYRAPEKSVEHRRIGYQWLERGKIM